MSKTRKCPNCGAKMPESMRFCGNCGAAIDQEEEYSDLPRPIRRPDEPRPMETAIRPEKHRGARRNLWQYILVIAIIAVVIAIAVILVLKMNQPAELPEPSESFDTVHVINVDGQEIDSTAAPEPQNTPEAAPQATETPETPAAEASTKPVNTPAPAETPAPTQAPESFDVTDAQDTVYVTGNGVNLRKGPGTNYDVVAVLSSGAKLSRTGTTDSSWSRVTYNGQEGYISNAFISTQEPNAASATPAPDAVTAVEDTIVISSEANIRKGPGTNYDVLGIAAVGTELKRTGRTNGWSRVQYNGQEGYVNEGLIREKTSDQLEEKTGTLTVTAEANLREGPNTTEKVLGLAQAGAKLNMTGKVGNWYRIEYDGKTAYIHASLVKES